MEQRAMDAEQLSAAISTIEDEHLWDAIEALDLSEDLERQTIELGDELLIQRARLCVLNLKQRNGNVAEAAQQIWAVHRWAIENKSLELLSRSHMVWANIHRMLGDTAQFLDHAVASVELLEAGSDYMKIWFRAKLGDALGVTDSMEAARLKYKQAADLCGQMNQPYLLLWVLNNWAYMEFLKGDPPRAQVLIERLREVVAEHEFDMHPAILDTIGCIELANGQFAEAEQTVLECIRKYDDGRFEGADSLAGYLITLAQARRGLGAVDRAQESLDEARKLCEDRDLGEKLVTVHEEQAELHAMRGEFAEAFHTYKIFHEAHQAVRSTELEAQARARQALFETTEARQEAEQFREQARRDPLTGLRNRRYVDEHLPALVEGDPDLTVAIVDLDHFKRINDQLSHDVGDQVLVQVAKMLENDLLAALPDSFVARLGGEEFLMVLPGTPVPAAAKLLDEIRLAVRSHAWDKVTFGLPVTVSIGLVGLDDAPARTQASLLSTADRNLYAAKHGGRDQVVFEMPVDRHSRSFRDLTAV